MGEFFRLVRFLLVWGLIVPIIIVVSCNALLDSADGANPGDGPAAAKEALARK